MPLVEDTPENAERFSVRYAGLARALQRNEVETCFVTSHASFNPFDHSFSAPYDINRQVLGAKVQPRFVRDLTLSLRQRPLYADRSITMLHHPVVNHFIADKSSIYAAMPDVHPRTQKISEKGLGFIFDLLDGERVIVKPITGQRSEGIQILDKNSEINLKPGSYLVQEFIDTSGGMPEHNIHGIHNLRIISVASEAIGGIARLKGSADTDILQDDHYGAFVHPDDMSDEIHAIINAVHDELRSKPGNGNNVIAIDVMRGIDAHGTMRDVLCEVNQRPVRIGPWNLRNPKNLDKDAIIQIGSLWDEAEAAMLAGLVHGFDTLEKYEENLSRR